MSEFKIGNDIVKWSQINKKDDSKDKCICPNHKHCMIPLKDMILVITSALCTASKDLINVFDCKKEEWFIPSGLDGKSVPLDFPQYGFSLTDNIAILFGGSEDKTKFNITTTNIDCNALHEFQLNTWTRVLKNISKENAPKATIGMSLTGINGKVYLFGGDDIITLRILTRDSDGRYNWELPKISGPQPQPRMCHSAAAYKNSLIISGGFDANGAAFNDVWICDVHLMTWRQIVFNENPFPQRSLHVTAVVGSRIIILGSTMESLNLETLTLEKVEISGEHPKSLADDQQVVVINGILYLLMKGEKNEYEMWKMEIIEEEEFPNIHKRIERFENILKKPVNREANIMKKPPGKLASKFLDSAQIKDINNNFQKMKGLKGIEIKTTSK